MADFLIHETQQSISYYLHTYLHFKVAVQQKRETIQLPVNYIYIIFIHFVVTV